MNQDPALYYEHTPGMQLYIYVQLYNSTGCYISQSVYTP